MTEVLCGIRSCTHWEDEHCRLSLLKIDGNAAAEEMNETLCASFAYRREKEANAGSVAARQEHR